MSPGLLEPPQIGLFGKLPATGDFVSRGLPEGLRPVLDRWLTASFAEIFDAKDAWPNNGIRAAFAWKTATVCLLIMPSQDRLGRKFPLSVCFVSPQPGISAQSVDQWANAVLPSVSLALGGQMRADDLMQHLLAAPVTMIDGPALEPPETWRIA